MLFFLINENTKEKKISFKDFLNSVQPVQDTFINLPVFFFFFTVSLMDLRKKLLNTSTKLF